MKKLIIGISFKTALIIAAMLSFAFISSQALACYWDGYWGGPMGGPMAGYWANTIAGGGYQAFQGNTAQLRQNLAAKQGEYDALMAQPNPDPKRAAQLRREITSLHDQLSAQARAYSLPIPPGGYGPGTMGGYGYGSMMGGYCW